MLCSRPSFLRKQESRSPAARPLNAEHQERSRTASIIPDLTRECQKRENIVGPSVTRLDKHMDCMLLFISINT